MIRLSDPDAAGNTMQITWIASCVADCLMQFHIQTGTIIRRLPDFSGIVIRTEEGKTICIDPDTASMIGLMEKIL